MAIPDYETTMRPVLEMAAAGEVHIHDCVKAIADLFDLTEEERAERIPSGTKTKIQSKVEWAATYLFQAGLLERPKRGCIAITERGSVVLQRYPERIDKSVLGQFPEFTKWIEKSKGPKPGKCGPTPGPSAWIFQCNPERYDLSGALGHLKEVSWLVKQSRHQIHEGHRVFLWESGDEAGILATATIITEPHVRENPRTKPHSSNSPGSLRGLS